MYSNLISLALDPVVNFGKVTVSTGYTSTALSIILNPGEGAKLPDPSVSGWYNLVWWNSTDYADPSDDPNVEIVRITSNIANTLGILRGQEGTLTSNKNTPGKTYKLILSPTKKIVDDIQTDAQNRVNTHTSLTSTHGVLGNIVGTTDIQTLTNKIISGNNNIISNIDFETAIKQDTFSNQSFQNLLQNGNFEFWYAGTNVAPTGWTLVGDAVARESTTIKVGTYSAKVSRTSATTYLYQNVPFQSYFKSRTFAITLWVNSTTSQIAPVRLSDGIGTTNSVNYTGGTGWQLITVTRTLDANANVFQVQLFAGENGDVVYYDGAILVEGSVVPAFMSHPVDLVMAETRMKVGSFIRDISTASGTQTVTGVGFKPSAIIFLGATSNTKYASVGFSDGITDGAIYSAITSGNYSATTVSISFYTDAGAAYYLGNVQSMNSDGFTINWLKGGSPTGIATIQYLAFR